MPTAMITGAAIRVGRAIALELAQAGYDLILHAHRSQDALRDICDEVRSLGRAVQALHADLSSLSEIEKVVQTVSAQHSSLDLMVHNAALFEKRPFEEVSPKHFQLLHQLNVQAPFFLSQGLMPLLRQGENPSIVHITDIMGERATAGYSHYGITKAALIHLTRSLAVELAPTIRVNGVSPGTVAFPENFDDEIRQKILQRIPLKREGTPRDIARAVLYFAQNEYVTGQIIAIDGGRNALL